MKYKTVAQDFDLDALTFKCNGGRALTLAWVVGNEVSTAQGESCFNGQTFRWWAESESDASSVVMHGAWISIAF
eukprot:2392731-Alexandrium_andersonii.AAC.1